MQLFLVGCSMREYGQCMQGVTAVRHGYDFQFNGQRYQVKANRPSGKPGSFVTLVPKAQNYDWDFLIWILYNKNYEIEEAWLWEAISYDKRLSSSNDLPRTITDAGSVSNKGKQSWELRLLQSGMIESGRSC
jgi:hypothetical protein